MTTAPTRVLYVDDDRINTLLFVEVCRPDPTLEIATAAGADEALESARLQRPDVMVIDLHLPDTDGLRLLADLRLIEGLAQTPAFLCTAERPDAVAADAARAGFLGCWSKPVSLDGIRADLARVLTAA